MLFPVLLDSLGELQESVMSSILVQIKRRKKKGTVAAYEINQKAVGLFPDDENVRPYVTLVAELGVQRLEEPVIKRKVREKLSHSDRMKVERKPRPVENLGTPSKLHIPSQPSRISHPRDVHPRYSFYAYGCSHTVYNVIAESDKPVYCFLLGHHDFLDEHARRDSASLSAVRRMKPVWSLGVDCYHWIEEEFLQQKLSWIDDEEGVLLVGKYQDEDDVFRS